MSAAPKTDNEARKAILKSIRSQLAASAPHDARESLSHPHVESEVSSVVESNGDLNSNSLAEMFKTSLEAVDGHCVIVSGDDAIVAEMTGIISALQKTKLRGKCLAISDNPEIERLVHRMDLDVDDLAVVPDKQDLFKFDVGISTVQAAIAETGTLVLDATRERHRLVSLVPPVHIALVKAANIRQTLGETLKYLRNVDGEVSRAITFITGPSRTADIELTLAIGVHGPQELYVIIDCEDRK
jgi:L-lactate dehydrogenase complex protein LldG